MIWMYKKLKFNMLLNWVKKCKRNIKVLCCNKRNNCKRRFIYQNKAILKKRNKKIKKNNKNNKKNKNNKNKKKKNKKKMMKKL